MRSVTGNWVELADFPRTQGLGPMWDSANSQMTTPGLIIVATEATKSGEGVFSR